jgi:hypothetical protein
VCESFVGSTEPTAAPEPVATPESAAGVAATLHVIERNLTDAAATLHALESRVVELEEAEADVDFDSVHEWLSTASYFDAVQAVPEGVQAEIIEDTLRSGGLDVEYVIDSIGPGHLIDRLKSRGDLEFDRAVSYIEAAIEELARLPEVPLEDVISASNDIADTLAIALRELE